MREIDDPLLQVPPASRGNRTFARFPSRSGGNLKEGGNCKLCPCDLACSYQGLQPRLQSPRARLEPRAPNQQEPPRGRSRVRLQ